MSETLPISEESQEQQPARYLDSVTAFMHLGGGYKISRVGWNGEKYLCAVPGPDTHSEPEVRMFDKHGAPTDWPEAEMEIDLSKLDWIVINIPSQT